jgi:hypothetical protein
LTTPATTNIVAGYLDILNDIVMLGDVPESLGIHGLSEGKSKKEIINVKKLEW